MKTFAVFALVLLPAASPRAQEPADDSFEAIRSRIVPPSEELAWREIPWRATFWEGVVEAQEKDKPILLWAMNGHPLACT